MKILIADDERPARQELRFMLNELLPSAHFDEAESGTDVLERTANDSYDVVFLDINMPGDDGLTVAARLLERRQAPRIVFATAYSEHAAEAFRLSAVDYVVKPFREDRLAQTVARLKTPVDQRESVGKLLWHQQATKLWGEAAEERWVLLDYAQLQSVQARDKKVFLHTKEHPPLRVRHTLKELEERLSEHGFLRVHKAYMVNLAKIREVNSWFSGSFTLVLEDGSQVPLSRRFVAAFKEATGW